MPTEEPRHPDCALPRRVVLDRDVGTVTDTRVEPPGVTPSGEPSPWREEWTTVRKLPKAEGER